MAKGLVKKTLIPVFIFISLFFIASCGDQSTFEVKGIVARRQLELFWIIFGLGVLVFVIVEGALIYSAFRFRRRPNQNIPKQTHGHTKLEVTWTILPALILIGIAIPTLIVIFNTSSSGGIDFERTVVTSVADAENEMTLEEAKRIKSDAVIGDVIEIPRLKVDVKAHQWWWEFRYPDYELETANELHIPIHTRIDLVLESDDVIHSFWIPNLMGKLDIVPTTINRTWFVAEESGIFKGQCAEFCGLAHAQMRFRVIAHDQSNFNKWIDDYDAEPMEPTGEALVGKDLFNGKGCLLCHSKDGPTSLAVRSQQREAFMQGDPVVPGPNLNHFATRTTMGAGIMPLTESNLEAWLADPDSVKPGNRMSELASVYDDSAQAMSADEVSALAAYLLTLRPQVAIVPTPTAISAPDESSSDSAPLPTPTALAQPTVAPIDLPTGDAIRGAEIFISAGPIACSTCHSLDGTVGLGPSLNNISEVAGTRVSGLNAKEYIVQSVLEPDAYVVDGFTSGLMPQGFVDTIGPQGVADVVEYLLSLE